MNGYMDLFLETGSPAFYMMAKQAAEATPAALDGASECRGNLAEHRESSAGR